MDKHFVIDTNVLLNDLHIIEGHNVVILSHVLRELEKHKINKNEDIAYRARRAVRFLEENSSKVKFDLKDYNFNLNDDFSKDYVDNLILQACKENDYGIITYDLLLKMKAKGFGIDTLDANEDKEVLYKGYKEVTLSNSEMNDLLGNPYENNFNLITNQYLIIRDINGDIVDKKRWDGEKLVRLKYPNIKGLKSKHYLQDLAMDLLNNTDITTKIIMGTYGSGKTYLSTKTSVHHVLDKGNFSKILVVREPVGDGKDIGYLPGEKDNKTADFFKPIEQSLEGSFFDLTQLEMNGTIEKEIPYFLKGTTYHQTIILVDEAEDLTYKQLKLTGTRVGEKSNIIFSGDYKQAIHNNGLSNGLIQLVNQLKGNPLFGVVDLIEDVRSETSKMFADLD
jgi:PhoH-like ATPase